MLNSIAQNLPSRGDAAAKSENAEPESGSASRFDLMKSLSSRRVLIVLGVLAALQAVALSGFALWHSHPAPPVAPPHPEVLVGDFRYAAERSEPGEIGAAQLTISVTLLPDLDATARAELDSRRSRVRQGLEQLLRCARPGDFEDPALIGLKRQVQARINDTLSMRAINEVIVTGLQCQFTPSAPSAQTDR